MYSNSIVRMATDGTCISISVETATESICHSMRHSHGSDTKDKSIVRATGQAMNSGCWLSSSETIVLLQSTPKNHGWPLTLVQSADATAMTHADLRCY